MSARDQLQAQLTDVVRSTVVELSFNVQANDGDDLTKEVPFDGRVTELFVGAAAAANNQVGIQLRYGGEKRLPGNRADEFIYPADLTHPYLVVFPVEEDTDLKLVYKNTSGTPHYIQVNATVTQFVRDLPQEQMEQEYRDIIPGPIDLKVPSPFGGGD